MLILPFQIHQPSLRPAEHFKHSSYAVSFDCTLAECGPNLKTLWTEASLDNQKNLTQNIPLPLIATCCVLRCRTLNVNRSIHEK